MRMEHGAGWVLAAEEFEKTAAVTRPENSGVSQVISQGMATAVSWEPWERT